MRSLAEAALEAAGCVRCPLSEGRTQVVFGVGSPEADLMFVGEAPGFHEDQQGEPFVGAAGQLLTRMLAEIGLARADVYIANVLKCRPPGNRDPQPLEIETCTPWLLEQLSIIRPRLVVTLGNFATKYVLETTRGITSMRGSVFEWQGRRVIPTYHPAAVLRGGERSRQFQELRDDFMLISRTLAQLQGQAEQPNEVIEVPEAAPPIVVPPGTPGEPDPDQLELF